MVAHSTKSAVPGHSLGCEHPYEGGGDLFTEYQAHTDRDHLGASIPMRRPHFDCLAHELGPSQNPTQAQWRSTSSHWKRSRYCCAALPVELSLAGIATGDFDLLRADYSRSKYAGLSTTWRRTSIPGDDGCRKFPLILS